MHTFPVFLTILGLVASINSENNCPAGEQCVPYYQCSESSTDSGVIDFHYIEETCPSYLEKCCSASNIIKIPTIAPSTNLEKCGFRNKVESTPKTNQRSVAGEAEFGEFPWTVAVLLQKPNTNGNTTETYHCAGSLIHPNVVLTAAHCVFKNRTDSWKIRAGEWDTQTMEEPLPYQERDVAEIVIHENYHKSVLHNDIALLFLKTPLDLADNVRTICLPPANITFDGSRCFVVGWGKDQFGDPNRHQVILTKTELSVHSFDQCQQKLHETRLGKRFQLHKAFMCAGGAKDTDSCRGDGGSPLICPITGENGLYYQAGILSWGIGCEAPGVYANVSELRNWLDEELEKKKIDRKFYSSS